MPKISSVRCRVGGAAVRERAQEITIFKGGVLPAFNAGQLFLDISASA
jgi:hypothetical protein